MKGSQTRLDDTIAFIDRKLTFIPATASAPVIAGLRTFLGALAGSANPTKDFSKGLSTSNITDAGDKDQRAARRAVDLLYHAMSGTTIVASSSGDASELLKHHDATLTSTAGIQTALDTALWKAITYYSNAGAKLGFDRLLASPTQFLWNNTLFAAGSPAGIEKYTDTPIPDMSNVRSFFFGYDGPKDRYTLTASDPSLSGKYGHPFQAASVPAIAWSDIPGRGTKQFPPASEGATFAKLRGFRLKGSDIMVTTQFTGCSFCYQYEGNHLYAAHVGPRAIASGSPALTGQQLAEQLSGLERNVGAAKFENVPRPTSPMQVFGANAGNATPPSGPAFYTRDSQTGSMTIIGLKRSGKWNLFTQSVSVSNRVTDARCIL